MAQGIRVIAHEPSTISDPHRRPIDKRRRTAAKTRLGQLRKDARDWIRMVERWSVDLSDSEASRDRMNGGVKGKKTRRGGD